MKKTFFLSFAASLLISSTALANDVPMQVQQAINGNTSFNFATDLQSSQKINAAIQIRQQNYLNEKRRTLATKNVNIQQLQHTLSRAQAGADGVSTYMNRSGELTDFGGTRTFAGGGLTAPNNSKRNFRTRAYDYYIDGGVAGTEALERDVISSSDAVQRRVQNLNRVNNAGAASIINSIRQTQKSQNRNESIATGEQRMSFRTGSQRNFIHPYMYGTQ